MTGELLDYVPIEMSRWNFLTRNIIKAEAIHIPNEQCCIARVELTLFRIQDWKGIATSYSRNNCGDSSSHIWGLAMSMKPSE